jgi:L-lactate dehydrogenase complex protein LldG
MQESTTREKVLKKIRKALISKTANPYPNLDFDSPVFRMNDEVPELIFAQAFRESGGLFVYCQDELEFAEALLNLAQQRKWNKLLCTEEKLSSFLQQCEFPVENKLNSNTVYSAAITCCECLVARTGSIMISSAQFHGRTVPLLSPVHIIVAFTNQLVEDLKDSINFIKTKYKDNLPAYTSYITGPSNLPVENNSNAQQEIFLFLIDKPGF